MHLISTQLWSLMTSSLMKAIVVPGSPLAVKAVNIGALGSATFVSPIVIPIEVLPSSLNTALEEGRGP